MAFGGFQQYAGRVFPDEFHGGNLDEIRGTLGEFDTMLVAEFFQAQNKGFPGENGGGGDGEIRFRLVHLDQFDLSALVHQGALDLFLAAELVGDGAGAGGDDVQHVLDGAGMAPGEHGVDASHFGIQLVIFSGADLDQGETVSEDLPDFPGDFQNTLVGGDFLTVPHPDFTELFDDGLVGIGAGNDHGAEEVALSAFVHADVRGECLGVQDIFVADLGRHQDEGFEGEGHEILGALALHHAFARLVEHDPAMVGIHGNNGIRHGGGLEIPPLQNHDQGSLLGFRQLKGERITCFHKRLVIADRRVAAKEIFRNGRVFKND